MGLTALPSWRPGEEEPPAAMPVPLGLDGVHPVTLSARQQAEEEMRRMQAEAEAWPAVPHHSSVDDAALRRHDRPRDSVVEDAPPGMPLPPGDASVRSTSTKERVDNEEE